MGQIAGSLGGSGSQGKVKRNFQSLLQFHQSVLDVTVFAEMRPCDIVRPRRHQLIQRVALPEIRIKPLAEFARSTGGRVDPVWEGWFYAGPYTLDSSGWICYEMVRIRHEWRPINAWIQGGPNHG